MVSEKKHAEKGSRHVSEAKPVSVYSAALPLDPVNPFKRCLLHYLHLQLSNSLCGLQRHLNNGFFSYVGLGGRLNATLKHIGFGPLPVYEMKSCSTKSAGNMPPAKVGYLYKTH